MDDIGQGFARVMGFIMLIAFVSALVIMGVIWGSVEFLTNDIESPEKVLYPDDYKIEINGKKIDTIYIYNQQ